jgi:hypothetical protein
MHTRSFALSAMLSVVLVSTLFSTSLAVTPAPQRDLSTTFGAFTGVHATLLAPSLRLRQKPAANAPVVATIRNVETESLQVTAISGDFVHVEYQGRDGWANIADVAPDCMALVLDPATGALVGRVPLGLHHSDGVVFSPDGSRALFYGTAWWDDNRPVATEVRMSDLTPVRTVLLPPGNDEDPNVLCDLFYGTDDAIYAAISYGTGEGNVRIAIVRVQDTAAPVFEGPGMFFRVSPDGKTGFVTHEIAYSDDYVPQGVTLDVMNLADFSIRSTFTLTGDVAAAYGGYVTSSYDGSEMYLLSDTSRVVVLETATGKVVREIPTGFARVEDAVLMNVCTGGGSLLVWAEGCVEDVPEGALWIDGSKKFAAPATITCAADAGATRYGVDAEGARLLTFGAGAKAVRTTKIARPEMRRGNTMLFPEMLTASPDRSRLILTVSVPNEECPC